MVHILRFVDQIATTPGVRLNLNDGKTWVTRNGTSFPPPPRRRALAQTLLTDGARVTADVYDNRHITLDLLLNASSADVQATQIQLLTRELDRPNNILQWWPESMTNPVFFRTFGSDITNVVEMFTSLRTISVDIMAEPFAYGPEVFLSPVTVNNDPTSSNGLFWDITGVLGDVETPAVFRMPADKLFDATKRQSLLATRRRGTPSSAPLFIQAEACTQGTDTTTQVNDATMSGAGNNYSRCTFATTAMTKRLTTTTPTSNTDLRGVYRVFVRQRHSVSGDSIALQMKWNNGEFANSSVTVPTGTLIRYIDLGLMSFPFGADPVFDGYSNVQQPVSGRPIELWAQRVSGSGNIDFDFFVFVPADDVTCYVKWVVPNDAAQEGVLDGQREMAYLLDATDNVYNSYSTGVSEIVGGFPLLMPNATNRIVFIRDVGSTAGATDAITGSTAVTVSYFPRYLYVRPAAT